MKKIFRTIDEVLNSSFGDISASPITPKSDRILKSTKLEDKLYADLRGNDADMDKTEADCTAKLPSFPSLARDIYQSFYSLNVRHNDESGLSDTAKQFNRHILDSVMTDGKYMTIKSVCEGRQLPAYDAAAEFVNEISQNLDKLLEEAGGDKNALDTLEKLAQQEENLKRALETLLENRDEHAPELEHERKIVDTANKAASKAQQVEAVGRLMRDNLIKNRDSIGTVIANAVQAAESKAEETALALTAWGFSEEGSSPEQMALDRDTINRVRKSTTLLEVSKYLGRFKEMAAKARKNSYAYGRGEKYSLELGNDLKRVLTSEFSMLATAATIPLFLRKYQSKGLKQYKRREPIFKGCGDIIVCLDESTSTKKDAPWGKAVALALLDAAMAGGRKLALIHFSGTGDYKTDVFIPGQYSTSALFAAAETFLGGGTNFVTPLKEALRLIENGSFENADIIFATDGECSLPDEFLNELLQKQASLRFTVTGVLLDVESPGMDFSITPFCRDIYRTSELAQDSIVESLLANRV